MLDVFFYVDAQGVLNLGVAPLIPVKTYLKNKKEEELHLVPMHAGT